MVNSEIQFTTSISKHQRKEIARMVLEVLKQLDIITAAELECLGKYYTWQEKNHKGEVVGYTKTDFELIKDI